MIWRIINDSFLDFLNDEEIKNFNYSEMLIVILIRGKSTEYSTFLSLSNFYKKGTDVYIGKAVCNEKCKHGLGRDLYLFI